MNKKTVKKAVALCYNEETDNAPKVNAKGWGDIAEKIIEIAKREEIPVVEDNDLVELLDKIEINSEVPEELFEIMAEVYAFLYKLNKEGMK